MNIKKKSGPLVLHGEYFIAVGTNLRHDAELDYLVFAKDMRALRKICRRLGLFDFDPKKAHWAVFGAREKARKP